MRLATVAMSLLISSATDWLRLKLMKIGVSSAMMIV